ncbi:MAG: tRNA threonylcarbamoyladenosine dehydratase [Candidatus Marinimicrobia bacterium]|nr:tRNA threonylcarbamoyladenosine dehydratase [Candidatus Neomarinimicrobiota bacterium]
MINRERHKRTELLLGREAIDRLHQTHITVIGLGAVGSHVVEALARCGVGALRIVDFDVISESNFNRQLLAIEPNLGRKKTVAAAERIAQIDPGIQVEIFDLLCHAENFAEVFAQPTDVIVDAIDSLNPKVNVLYEAVTRQMKIVSCMGAARKVDPTKITTGDISQTQMCPLAKFVRKRLRNRGIYSGVHCVYSTELINRETVAEETEENYYQSGRERLPVGSLPMITGIFGYVAANEALKMVVDYPDFESPGRSSFKKF